MGSFFKTMAGKYKTSVVKTVRKLNRGGYFAVRVKRKDGEVNEYKLFRPQDVDRTEERGEKVNNLPLIMKYTGRTELQQRREAQMCEYCEREKGYFEVHHVRKLADIKNGKEPWKKLMIARRRKTLIVCIQCHHDLHNGTLPDRRHMENE